MASTFPYAIDGRITPFLRLLGVKPDRDGVTLSDDGVFRATYGFFAVETPVSNIATAETTGPYSPWKAIGLRLSAADSGVTFGTSGRSGACVTFHEKVDRVIGFRPHRGLTVTVADPDALVAAIREAQGS